MGSFWKSLLHAAFMGFVVPWIALSIAVMLLEDQNTASQEITVQSEASTPLWTEADLKAGTNTILLRDGQGMTGETDLETYLLGVVLAEMPAYFEPEALKAQSVVARTYALKTYTTGGKHGDGSICTQSNCCQAYISEEAYLSKGGTQDAVDKVRGAVMATAGKVLTYEGNLIEATYFSCSGGRTEDAVAVWGTDFPYLRSVESPGEENAAHYTDTVSFTAAEFQRILGTTFTGTPESWFGSVTYTAGGGVDTMVIGEITYRGTQLRTLLGLRSTAFTVRAGSEEIMITTKGFGHRVGMSQYGADAMAVSGSTWQEILYHYYPGTEIACLEKEKHVP